MLKQLGTNLYSISRKYYTPSFNMVHTSTHNNSQISNNSFKHDVEVERIVWMDLEMSGLDVEKDRIMEVAVLVTDANLNIVAEVPELVINQPSGILDNMNDWCTKQHGKTGLTEASRKSNISTQDAENTVLSFLKQHLQPGMSPLAGNSVFYDRMFIKRYMPKVEEFMHYRTIDVSTIKELCKRWNADLFKKAPKKEFNHRALSDIKESIEELKYYKNNFMKTL